jgi:hypothetical protein
MKKVIKRRRENLFFPKDGMRDAFLSRQQSTVNSQ